MKWFSPKGPSNEKAPSNNRVATRAKESTTASLQNRRLAISMRRETSAVIKLAMARAKSTAVVTGR